MTPDDIIEMARQADREWDCDREASEWVDYFAKLVAAKEQEAIIDLVAFYGGPVELEAAIRARGQA